MKRSIEWAAGLFEGEGCITQRRREGKNYICKVQMTDLDVLEDFRDTMGGHISGPNKIYKPHHKPSWTWRIGGDVKVRNFLDVILPHLGNRRAYKALNVLEHLELSI